jgi:hypothetical protein
MAQVTFSRSIALAFLAVVAFSGCGNGTGPDGNLELQIVGGDGQTGPAGTELPIALTVRAVREDRGVANVRLTFDPPASPAAIVGAPDATGSDGTWQARVRLGAAGTQTIRVRIDGEATQVAFTATAVAAPYPALVKEVPIPPNYGIHDTFVRDGIAFVAAWSTGVIIYDVGDGRQGGSPSNPIEISRVVTNANGVPGGVAAHNTWWFHNPTNGQRRYLFVGQEGPGTLFTSSSGDLHVVDVSDLSHPVEVASLTIQGAGVHNFWMDEPGQTLYAAYYNAGVIAVDVSGTLQGNLNSRIKRQKLIGGNETYTWGVMLANGSLWANDIVTGFYRLDPTTLEVLGGGHNVPERWGSDLWIHGSYGYTGSWGGNARNGSGFGDAIKIWDLRGAGPVLADSLIIPDIRTVSDLEVSDDGGLLAVTTERLGGQGLKIYDLANPIRPALLGEALVSTGLHTGSLARIGGRLFAFTAKNPANPALQVYDITPPPP